MNAIGRPYLRTLGERRTTVRLRRWGSLHHRGELGLREHLVQGVSLLACRQIQHWQLFAQDHVIVRRNPAVPHLATSQAFMHDHLLTAAPKSRTNWFHQASALVLTIPRSLIDVSRIEAQRAMITLPATADWRSHERFAVPAFELFQLGLPQRWCAIDAISPPARRFSTRGEIVIVVLVVEPLYFSIRRFSHVGSLHYPNVGTGTWSSAEGPPGTQYCDVSKREHGARKISGASGVACDGASRSPIRRNAHQRERNL